MARLLVNIRPAGNHSSEAQFCAGDRVSVAYNPCTGKYHAWDWKFGFYREIVVNRREFETELEYEKRERAK